MSNEVMIADPKTGGVKGRKDERFDLLPWDAMEELARVYAIGAKKYADDNWLKGYAWRLSFGALFRHVARAMCGEDRDPETGCLHLAHAAWHCLTLITFKLRGLGTDDRKPPKLKIGPPITCRPDSVPPPDLTEGPRRVGCKPGCIGCELEREEAKLAAEDAQNEALAKAFEERFPDSELPTAVPT